MAMRQTRILIADDHPIVREGLKEIVSRENDMIVGGEAANASETIETARAGEWDLVLLDLSMPGRGGVEVLQELRREFPGLPVLVLSVHPENQLALRALKAGASGYINEDAAPEELIGAVRRVAGGGRYVSPALMEKLIVALAAQPERPPAELLSKREFQVLRLLASGKSVSRIAAELSRSVKTVSTQRARILRKLRLHNTADLIRFALERGLPD